MTQRPDRRTADTGIDPALSSGAVPAHSTEPAAGERVTAPVRGRGMVTIPRTRGALNGLIIALLGVWGAIIPFVGPYFHYAYINYQGFSFPTYGRLWLEILPGLLAFIAGLELVRTANRATAALSGALAAIAGAWFLVGPSLSMLWNHGAPQTGPALGGSVLRTLEQLGYFYALGAVILLLAAVVLGRISVVSVRDVRAAERADARRRREHEQLAAEPTRPIPPSA